MGIQCYFECFFSKEIKPLYERYDKRVIDEEKAKLKGDII